MFNVPAHVERTLRRSIVSSNFTTTAELQVCMCTMTVPRILSVLSSHILITSGMVE